MSKHAGSARMITNQCNAVGIPQKLLCPDNQAKQSSDLCGRFRHQSIRISRISRLRLCTVNTGAKQDYCYAYLKNQTLASSGFLLLEDLYPIVSSTLVTISSAFCSTDSIPLLYTNHAFSSLQFSVLWHSLRSKYYRTVVRMMRIPWYARPQYSLALCAYQGQ